MFFQITPRSALATPTGADVAAGSAGVTQSGNTTSVTIGSSRSIINWGSLDTAGNETLQFTKASGGFTVLNRVTEGGATQFNGTLLGNQGHIIIVNPNGVVFGQSAFIDATNLPPQLLTSPIPILLTVSIDTAAVTAQ